jgi:hypothetical protein
VPANPLSLIADSRASFIARRGHLGNPGLSASALGSRLPVWSDLSLAGASAKSLLGDPLTTRVATSLAPALQEKTLGAAELASQLVTRHVAMAAMIGMDWAERLQRESAFGETFAGRVVHSIEEIISARDETSRAQETAELRNLLQEFSRGLPRTGLSRDTWATIIVTVVMMLVVYALQSRDADRSTSQIVNALHDLPHTLMEAEKQSIVRDLPRLREQLFGDGGHVVAEATGESGPLYVVTKEVNVRAAPSVRSPRLCLLHPGQAVERIEKKRKWVRIAFFDFLAAEQREGWVSSKYLRRIGPREKGGR